ncbi:hypothetical protein AUJ87_00570 [Candidatus Gracilibacteria bacterium CG1_02_38_174]|nr:MAG: hypothetical protein AUJ87_00570 [Candidatus Gracilibacteria bacterium CG1_02_38_174]PIQ11831.1 MAG: hypothetical protein COW68_01750 [Candidatus Gracilibacteria bacterium CG18_big_fil_WC_8_21_14_2_50_38_16]PIQ41907.1 MAG: hypothetical protein COW06_01450 [Candidatus Gracilibacteria bacterium CG12_big_fil_rev_8_21_14_0_65_38_15]
MDIQKKQFVAYIFFYLPEVGGKQPSTVVEARKLKSIIFEPEIQHSDVHESNYSCKCIFEDRSQKDIQIPVRNFKKALSRVGETIWFVTNCGETNIALSKAEMFHLSRQNYFRNSIRFIFEEYFCTWV